MSSAPQFQLIDHGWKTEFETAGALKANDLLVISPFIKRGAVQQLTHGKKRIRVLTRHSLREFLEGVSDLNALRYLLEIGSEVRGIKNLHAKVYVFGELRSIVTSANLTDAALTRNHELGFVSDDAVIIQACRAYFENLWSRAGKATSLNTDTIDKWEAKIAPFGKTKSGHRFGLGDYGANLGFLPDPPSVAVEPTISKQAFVKFIGGTDDRANLSESVPQEIAEYELNWAVSSPLGQRPRQPKTGDVIFIGRMVEASDTRILGRAIAYEYKEGRDDATAADIQRLKWRKDWPHLIRLRDPEFIDGVLGDGISLNELMNEFGAKSFASTERNAREKNGGNTNPRLSIRQKPHILLSQDAAEWVNARFFQAVAQRSRVIFSQLKTLHWPTLPD